MTAATISTSDKNESFFLYGVQNTGFQEVDKPTITSDDEVIVQIRKTGICGSGVHYLCHGRIGDFVVNEPMVLGHESAGVVVQGEFSFSFLCLVVNHRKTVGAGVPSNIAVGTRVAIEPGVSCRHCTECRAGKYHLCDRMVFAATPPYPHGTLCRYYKVPYDLVYPLPWSCSLEDGALIEPLSVAIHALSTIAQLKSTQNVAVFGAGPVGLLCMATAKALGARSILLINVNPARLEFAKSYAATETYLAPPMLTDETTIAYAKRVTEKWGKPTRGPEGYDVVIEASGAETCVQMSCMLAKVGGTVVQVGMGKEAPQVPVTQVSSKELTYRGSFRYGPGDYALAISLVASGQITLSEKLVTHRYAFSDAQAAFSASHAGKGADGKPVIKVIM